MRILWLLCLAFLLPESLAAQPRSTAEAHLDADRITVGAPLHLTLQVRHRPLLGTLRWPALPDTFNKLEVLQRSAIDTLSDGENTVYRQEITLTGFDSVLTAVPSLAFTVQPDAGGPYTVATEPLPILVSTLPVDTTKPFRPIRDILPAPEGGGPSNGLLLILAGLALLGLFVFGVLYLRRVREKAGARRQVLTGLQQLDALQAEGLLQQGAVKAHYTRLANILRGEISRQYRFATRERPTSEILEQLPTTVPAETAAQLRRILEAADVVKFAQAVPTAEASAHTLQDARQVLTQITAAS